MHTDLALRLRNGTQALHTTTERAGIMPALLRGQLPLAGFLRLQASLLLLYQALEAGLQAQAAHPLLAPLPLGPLARSARLQADVQALAALAALGAPAGAAANASPVAGAVAYADRLQALAQQQPLLLVAHAYVRYLGDLAGGQALARVARRAYGLQGSTGTRFFDFGPPDAVQDQARALRHALDTLPLDEAGITALVTEAQWAFAAHARLFEELTS